MPLQIRTHLYHYKGKTITGFASEVFKGDSSLEKRTVQSNITWTLDSSFTGTSLNELVMKQSDPAKVRVGFKLLGGVEDCKILVPKGSLANYSTDYFWGHYVKNLEEVE